MYCIGWERYDNPDVQHHGPLLYKISSTSGKKVPYSKKETEALVQSANKHFTEGRHWAVKLLKRKKLDLKPNPSIRT